MGLKVNMKETNGVVCTYLRIKEAQIYFDTNIVGLSLDKYISKEQRDIEKLLAEKKQKASDISFLIEEEYLKTIDQSTGEQDLSKLDTEKVNALNESLSTLYKEINEMDGNYVYSTIYVTVPLVEPVTQESLYKSLQELDQFKDALID